MALDFLLCNCLIPGKTHLGESGKSARLAQHPGETVLAFKIDSNIFRKEFGVSLACDGLFFYLSEDYVGQKKGPLLLLVELKGRDIEHGIDQLAATLAALQKPLRRYRPNFKAVIVSKRGVPESAKDPIQQFFRKHGISLKVTKNEDLREFV